jgi:hypothetical protein
MPRVKFTAATMPKSGEELKQALNMALEKTRPLDEFIQGIRSLAQWELQYGISSESFFARFEAGELGDEIDLLRWATAYEVYQESKAELEQMVGLLERYALPVMA